MAGREGRLSIHAPKQPADARGARSVRAPVRPGRCLGAAAQLVAVHGTLRRGPALQLRAGGAATANRTGLPDRLKAGVEALSGVSLNAVEVHYNSSEPAQLNALAYAQGSDIHLAPGQERHLPHEAWHLVQQAQGRVQPTLQMKDGVPVNDDAALEREADMMGDRAMGIGRSAPGDDGIGAAPSTPPLRSAAAAPRQLYVAPAPDPNMQGALPPTFAQILADRDRAPEIFIGLNWVGPAEQIYQLINLARATRTEDADVEELLDLEAEADRLVRDANAHVVEFNRTPRFEPRVSISTTLSNDRILLNDVLAQIQQHFFLAEGGFGAKGRATEVANVDIGAANQGRGDANNSFIANITIDGQRLTDQVGVARPAGQPDPGVQRLRVNGVLRAGLPPAQFNDALDRPQVNQPAANVTNFLGAARDGGQEVNMGGTNARGYAWATNTPGWNTTQWEWLHIRGASLGGATNPTNLVLGTRDANTHMIPFESNLKSLATLARTHPHYRAVSVTWSIAAEQRPHRWASISIDWTLHKENGAPAHAPTPSGTATFSPLATGTVLSKTEVEYLEDALRAARPVVPDVEIEQPPGGESGEKRRRTDDAPNDEVMS